MGFIRGRSKDLKGGRLHKKPKHEDKDQRKKKAWEMCEELEVKPDDGASRAYRKLGRSRYENYVKDMAQLWWDVPPGIETSGLLMETSKLRLRGGPIQTEEDPLLMQGYPQPHYTLKILKTAFKIYRIRSERRYRMRPDIKTGWYWTDDKRDEEPKWAYIIDRPLLEQYILLLEYIRGLAGQLAWQMGHKEIVCSSTPYRAMERLHPLKHLDFRGAKHYLPKPFVTASDSDTQIRINRELKRLDKALAKASVEKEHDLTTPPGMIAPEEAESSSSSSLLSEELEVEDVEEILNKEEMREHTDLNEEERKLLERKGKIYISYKDPGSEESLFVDFADLGQYVEFRQGIYGDGRYGEDETDLRRFSDFFKSDENLIKPDEDQEDDDEKIKSKPDKKKKPEPREKKKKKEEFAKKIGIKKQLDKLKKKADKLQLRKGAIGDIHTRTIQLIGGENNLRNEGLERSNNSEAGNEDSRNHNNDDDTSGTSPGRENIRQGNNFFQFSDKNNKPGSSHDDENGNIDDVDNDDDEEPDHFLPQLQNIASRGDGDVCILTTNYQRNFISDRLRSAKIKIDSTLITADEVQSRNDEEIISFDNRRVSVTGGGDAVSSMNITDEIIRRNLTQTASSLQRLMLNMTIFYQRSNNLLDNVEESVGRIELALPQKNSSKWDEMKRHIKIVIRRLPKPPASG